MYVVDCPRFVVRCVLFVGYAVIALLLFVCCRLSVTCSSFAVCRCMFVA